MRSLIISTFLSTLFFCAPIFSQQIIELASMPEKVSNNAVCKAKVGTDTYVYSFAGIDETKEFSGIHKRAFRYSVAADQWETIDELPTGNGRIAAGASVVKNKVYIIGGYEVFEDGTEASFDNVHIYDPELNQYLDDGAPIPVPIDDHIQAVWRDSLIYVVTGWSNEENVPDVQIYDPLKNEWLTGTPTPDNSTYKAFGASGIIVDDVIYYCGGVRVVNGSFASANAIRIGRINPADPTSIEWSNSISSFSIGYRMAAATFDGSKPVWIGGGETGYNFDGLAYTNGQGVEPLSRILEYTPSTERFTVNNFDELEVMDLRGAAQLAENSVIICGGMMSGQEVSDKTFMIDISLVPTADLAEEIVFSISPNPAKELIRIESESEGTLEIFAASGALQKRYFLNRNMIIDSSTYAEGLYVFVLKQNGNTVSSQTVSIIR